MEVFRSFGGTGTSHIVFHPSLAKRFEYDIEIVDEGGVPDLKLARKLIVRVGENGNTLDFKEKKDSDHALLVIPLKDIRATNIVTVQTKRMMIKRDNTLLKVEFIKQYNPSSGSPERDNQAEQICSIQFDLNRDHIQILIEQINQFKEEEVNASITRAIAVAKDSNLCIQCAKSKYVLKYRHDYNLCRECFVSNYGRPILETPDAEFYGGHKAYLGGGTFDKFEYGRLLLSEHYLTFLREHDNPTKRWEIIIPLGSVIEEKWSIEEEARRKSISGLGVGVPFGFGVGGAFIHDSGKAHRLVVPYIDENGIPQEPRFGISSFRGKAIREWAAKLYQQVVIEKRDSNKFSVRDDDITKQQLSQEPVSSPKIDDPLKILKVRFAKGEITKEEYEEMRKMLE